MTSAVTRFQSGDTTHISIDRSHHVTQRGNRRQPTFFCDGDYDIYMDLMAQWARMVKEPWRYRWSSAKAHLTGQDDGLVKVKPLLERYGDWRKVL